MRAQSYGSKASGYDRRVAESVEERVPVFSATGQDRRFLFDTKGGMGSVFGTVAQLLQRAMGGASQRHEVIANNIANANTPNFKRQEVDFLTSLRREMDRHQSGSLQLTHPNHQSEHAGGLKSLPSWRKGGLVMRNDGNSVDIESEMVEMAKNSLYYNAVANQLQSQLSRLRTAITEGRR